MMPISQRIAVNARRYPNHPALISQNHTVNYAKFDALTRCAAQKLMDIGLGTGSRVGLHLRPAAETVIAAVGVLRAGGVCVPLDPNHPAARLSAIMGDANVELSVVSKDSSGTPLGKATIPVDELCGGRGGTASRDPETLPDQAAWILYTSGTSGRPRGVFRSHRAITCRLDWIRWRSDDVACLNMSLSVGFSQERMFLPLLLGLPLVVLHEEEYSQPDRLAKAVRRHGVTRLTTVPSMLRLLLGLRDAERSMLGSLRSVDTGGSELSSDLARLFLTLLPQVELVNAYGSTEAGSVIRGSVKQSDLNERVPIGKPVPHCKIRIVDDQLRPVAHGKAGELLVTGPGIALGYVNDPSHTATRFISDPCGEVRAFQMYRTGDVALERGDGSIELLGRLDRQVKVRGYRVELDEVERAVDGHPGVAECVVTTTVQGDEADLVAYVSWRREFQGSVGGLRRWLEPLLPAYMIPKRFLTIEAVPRLENGKVDFTRVHSKIDDVHDEIYEPPQTDCQTTLVDICRAIIDCDEIGIRDDLLLRGADSLSIAQIILAVSETFDVELSVDVIRANPTIAAVASSIERLKASSAAVQYEIPVIERNECLPLFQIQEAQLIAETTGLGPRVTACLCLRIRGHLDRPMLAEAMACVFRRHEALRAGFRKVGTTKGHSRSPSTENGSWCGFALPADTILADELVGEAEDVESADELAQRMATLLARGIPCDKPPLVKVSLYALKGEHYLVLSANHLVVDGHSFSVIAREWLVVYEWMLRGLAGNPPLPESRLHQADCAEWCRVHRLEMGRSLHGERVEAAGAPWPLTLYDLPTFAVNSGGSGGIHTKEREIEPEISDGIRRVARSVDVSVFALMVGVVGDVFRRRSGREHFSVLTLVDNRWHPEVSRVVGWFSRVRFVNLDYSHDKGIVSVAQSVAAAVNSRHFDSDLSRYSSLYALLIEAEMRIPEESVDQISVSMVSLPQVSKERPIRIGIGSGST